MAPGVASAVPGVNFAFLGRSVVFALFDFCYNKNLISAALVYCSTQCSVSICLDRGAFVFSQLDVISILPQTVVGTFCARTGFDFFLRVRFHYLLLVHYG